MSQRSKNKTAKSFESFGLLTDFCALEEQVGVLRKKQFDTSTIETT